MKHIIILFILLSSFCFSQNFNYDNLSIAEKIEIKEKVKSPINFRGPSTPDQLFSEPEQDCNSAIPVCQNTFTQSQSYSGFGNIDEIPSNSSCLGSNEKNSVWYVFTVNSAGNLAFNITPLTLNEDYDFALYEITNGGCAGIDNGSITPIRCNFSVTGGVTGLSSSGTNPSEGSSGPNQSSVLPVSVGQTYVLVLSNYSSSQNGYTLNFGPSSASIFDVTPPTILAVTAPCGSTTITVKMSEQILCSSISANASEFTVTGTGGTYNVVSAVGVNCGNATNEIRLTLNTVLSGGGPWTVTIGSGTDGNTLIDNCGNALSAPQTKTFNTSPPTASITGDNSICKGQTMALSANTGSSYSWNGPGTAGQNTGQTISVVQNTAGTFNYSVTVGNGTCGSSTATVAVTVTDAPTANFTVPTLTVCAGSPITFTNTSTYPCSTGGLGINQCNCGTFFCNTTPNNGTFVTYLWTFGDGGSVFYLGGSPATAFSPAYTYNTPGVYTANLNASGTINTCDNNFSRTITVLPAAAPITANASNPNICPGQSSNLTASGSASYTWTGPGGFTSTSNPVSVSPTTTTTYTVSSPGCSGPNTATVTVNVAGGSLSTGPINGINQVCSGANNITYSITNNSGSTYNWTIPAGSTIVSGQGTNSITINFGTTAGTIAVSETSSCGTGNASLTLGNNGVLPDLIMGSNQIITCTNSSVTLNGTSNASGVSYVWNPGGSSPNSSSTNVTLEGTYQLNVYNPANGCSNSGSVSVTTNTAVPNANAGNDQIITCSNNSVTLTGNSTTANVSYIWSNGVLNPNQAITSTNTDDTYTLTVTDPSNGCTSTDIVIVSSNTTLPNVNAGTDQLLTCNITSVTLNGNSTSPNVTYSWLPAGTSQNAASTTVSSSGSYTLTVTDTTNGCSSTDIVDVLPDANLPDIIMGNNQILTCSTTSVTISGLSNNNNVTYNWDSSVSNSNGSSASVNAPGDYTLTVSSNLNGCSNSGIVSVSIDTISPNVSAGADQTLSCTITSVTLIGSSTTNNVSYSWSPSGSSPNLSSTTVNAVGEYTLTVTNPLNGCNSSDVVQVLPDANLPSIIMGQTQVINCATNTVTISGQTSQQNVSFSWSPPGSSPTLSSTQVTSAGTYSLTITDNTNGCSSTGTVSVITDNTIPDANIISGSNITCNSPTSLISGTSSTTNATFLWTGPNNFSNNQASSSVSTAGTYTLIVTHPVSSCTNTITTVVGIDTVSPIGTINSTATSLTCLQTSIGLTGSSATVGVSFQWSNSSGNLVGNPTSINSAGTYSLTTTNPLNGCSTVSSILINQDISIQQAQANISSPSINCEISEVFLTSNGNANYNYIWSGPNAYNSLVQNPTPGVNTVGTYTLYYINPANGCSDSSFVLLIEGQNPAVDFTANPTEGYVPLTVNFTNQSSNGFASYQWIFGDGNVSSLLNPNNNYQTPGTFTITLIGNGNVSACNDTIQKTIIVLPEIKLIIPNVFTPNNDGNNDDFYLTVSGFKELDVFIYNRWGSVICSFNGIGGKWTGVDAKGKTCAEGTYYCLIKGVKSNNENFESHNYISLYR